jgi:hypothetical protein
MGAGCGKYDDSHRGFVKHAQKAAGIVFVCLLVWAVSGFGYFWPVWVVAGLGLALAGHARRVYGGRDDREEEFV